MIKEQFVGIVREKEQQEQCIRELREKVEDMKYTIQEMRHLNEKQERIHLREMELFEMEKQKYKRMLEEFVGDCAGLASGIGNSINVNNWGNGNSRDNETINYRDR
jgi:hypothetical protein